MQSIHLSNLIASSCCLLSLLDYEKQKLNNERPSWKSIAMVTVGALSHAVFSYAYWSERKPHLENALDPAIAVFMNFANGCLVTEFALKCLKSENPSPLQEIRRLQDSSRKM